MSNGATAVRLDGRQVSRELLEECRSGSQKLSKLFGVVPHLAVVLVGDDPASAIYVRAKERACDRASVRSTVVRMAASTTTAEVCAAVEELAVNPAIHGIIVQLPLPPAIDPSQVFSHIPAARVSVQHAQLQQGSLAGRPAAEAPIAPSSPGLTCF